MSQPPQRLQYILYHLAITVNHGSLPRLCHIIGLSFTRETANGPFRYCGHRAGWLRSSHRRCAATYRQGLAQLVDLVAVASGRPDFTQRRMLRILDGLAQQCYVPAQYLHAVLAAGWHLSDLNRMVNDVLTQSETVRLREFRDGHHPESETPGDPGASILAAAARAALATCQRSRLMERVSNLLQRSGLSHEEGDRRQLVLPACCLTRECYRNFSTWNPLQSTPVPAVHWVPLTPHQSQRRPVFWP